MSLERSFCEHQLQEQEWPKRTTRGRFYQHHLQFSVMDMDFTKNKNDSTVFHLAGAAGIFHLLAIFAVLDPTLKKGETKTIGKTHGTHNLFGEERLHLKAQNFTLWLSTASAAGGARPRQEPASCGSFFFSHSLSRGLEVTKKYPQRIEEMTQPICVQSIQNRPSFRCESAVWFFKSFGFCKQLWAGQKIVWKIWNCE